MSCERKLRASLAYPVAGALAFTKYGRLQRYAFVLFARVPYDVTHDCEYTDKRAVERRLDELLAATPGHNVSDDQHA